MTKERPLLNAGCMGAFLALLLSIPLSGFLPAQKPAVTPDEHKFGLAENHLALAEPIRDEAFGFVIVGADGDPVPQNNVRSNVRLWDAELAIETPDKPRGQFWKNFAQEDGDCVSQAICCGVTKVLCVQAVRSGQHTVHRAYPPYQYGASRVWVGKGRIGSGAGSIVAWAAQAISDPTMGILAFDDPGVPPYSGAIAKAWGAKGPPEAFRAIAKARVIKTVSPIKTVEEARDAICNGYPVPFGAMFGTNTIRPRDGRMVAVRDARWAHAMCMVAYDGSLGEGKEYIYILNSWGEDAHPAPLQGEPPGGFWVTLKDADWICRTGDAWAISNLEGFPARKLIDWDQFEPEARANGPDRNQFAVRGSRGRQLGHRANTRKTENAL